MIVKSKELSFLDNVQYYCELYVQGTSLGELLKICGLPKRKIEWLKTQLTEQGIKLRTQSENNRVRFKYTLQEDAFDLNNASEDQSYFLGYILADGCLVRNYLIITLKQTDGYILKELQTFLKANYGYSERSVFDNRTQKEYHRAVLQVGSPVLRESLERRGIFNKKSCLEKIPNIDYLRDKDFWRGVVDGDGHVKIHATGNPSALVLVGSKEVVDGFMEFVYYNFPSATRRTISKKTYKNKTLYKVQLTGKDAIGVATYLYKGSSLHLKRKYNEVFKGEVE